MGILKRQIFFQGFLLFFCFTQTFSLQAAPSAIPAPAVSASSALKVGIVAAVKGAVKIASQGQVGQIAGSGQPVFLGDEISTDQGGSLQILLLDQTVFTIGPNSAIVIDKFVYDPETSDGEVKAKVVKGVFRFVTGKIGQKKPQQMEVALPAGTIGIRGTIVAGEVEGKRSKVVLLGPGEKNNTGHREGRFILSNESQGVLKQETVSKTGFASLIEGEGMAPVKPFLLPAEDLMKLTNALGPIAAAPGPGSPQAPGPGIPGSGKGEGRGEKPEGNPSPTERAGQGKALSKEFVQQSGRVGRLIQRFVNETDQASQREIQEVGKILNGPSSRDQLQSAAQRSGGVFHFFKTGIPLAGAQSGSATIYYDINFGARRVGGGNSQVYGSITSGTFEYDLPERPFGFGPENAAFNYPGIVKETSSNCTNCAVADIDIGLNNRNGNVAADANVSINIKTGINGTTTAKGSDILPRFDGASPP